MKYSLVKTVFVVASALLVAGCDGTLSSSSASATIYTTDSAASSDTSKFYAYEANSDLVFNEFDVGVSANDRALELANKGDSALDLSAYSIAIYHANDQKPTYFITLAGKLASKATYVIASDTANTTLKSKANQVSPSLVENGSWPMVLLHGDKRVDTLGTPGYQTNWGIKSSMVRKDEFRLGRDVYEADDWIFFDADNTSYLGTYASPLTDEAVLAGPRLTASDLALPYVNGSVGGGGVVSVTVASYGDGDTTRFNLPSSLSGTYGSTHSFRYQNVDTPETDHETIQAQPWGYAAADFTNGLLKSASHILIQSIKGGTLTETYGRLLGFVWVTTVSNPTPGDYTLVNHEIVVNGYSKVAFSGAATSEMFYAGLSYYSYLVDGNNHAAKLGLKVHGETDPNFNY
jgi:endonuclease YncB( thermonuclease family)